MTITSKPSRPGATGHVSDGTQLITTLIGRIETAITTKSGRGEVQLSVQQLADELAMSRFQLQRLFKQRTGVDLSSFIRRLKLECAANHVCLTNMPLIQIAQNMGWAGQQAFTRAFSKYWGVPPHRMRGAAKHRFAPFLADRQASLLQASLIPMRIEHRATPPLWIRRFVGSYRDVLTYWRAFAAELDAFRLSPKGPFYGVIYDDPDIVADGAIRYGCAIEALPGTALPPDFVASESGPSRFAIFSIHCTYLEGHARLRPRVLTWFQQSGEAFGAAGAFEVYQTLPSGGDATARRMELCVSLAG